MAFSNDKLWSWTRDLVVDAALRKLGEYDEGDAPSDAERTTAAFALNAMIREWVVTDGVGLWLRKRCILILNRGLQRYSLGPDGTPGTVDDFHFFFDDELIENTISADEAAGQTTLSILDANWKDYAGNTVAHTVVANSDVIGIRQDDLTIHWSTVSTSPAGSDTLIIAGAGLDSAASAGAKVYTYTARAPRPHGIVYAYRETTSGNASETELIGRREFERLSLKTSSGVPVKVHFDPALHLTDPTKNFALLHVWPVKNPKSYDKQVLVCEFYPDEVLNTNPLTAGNITFPDEWANALVWNLANELSLEYEVSIRTALMIQQRAKEKYENLAFSADREEASLVISRETYGRL